MLIRHRKRAIPRCWKTHPKAKGLIVDTDIIIGSSRLAAKLLVFKTRKQLRDFWKNALGRPSLHLQTRGVVSDLSEERGIIKPDGTELPKKMIVDPYYYCVIGLCLPELDRVVLAHEAGHAAFCYARRVKRAPWHAEALQHSEEAVCYPLGVLFNQICEAVAHLW